MIKNKKKLKTLIENVNQWAEDKGIHSKGNCFTQLMKTHEEVGELINAIYHNNREETIDALGDILVTIINAVWFTDFININEVIESSDNHLVEPEEDVFYNVLFLDKHKTYLIDSYVKFEKEPDGYNKDSFITDVYTVVETLLEICYVLDLDITDCLEAAYNVISKRSGKIVNGQFIKDK